MSWRRSLRNIITSLGVIVLEIIWEKIRRYFIRGIFNLISIYQTSCSTEFKIAILIILAKPEIKLKMYIEVARRFLQNIHLLQISIKYEA